MFHKTKQIKFVCFVWLLISWNSASEKRCYGLGWWWRKWKKWKCKEKEDSEELPSTSGLREKTNSNWRDSSSISAIVAIITRTETTLRTYYMLEIFNRGFQLINFIEYYFTLLNTTISMNILRWVIIVKTFYYKFRVKEVSIFLNVAYSVSGGNGKDTKEANG